MTVDPAVDEATFEKEALGFLEAAVPRRPPEALAWGEGSDSVAIFHETTAEEEAAEVAAARAWQRRRWEAGFGWITGPPEYGGGGLPLAYDRLYRALEGDFAVPDMSPLRIGVGTVAPAIMAHGTEVQKREVAVGVNRVNEVVARQNVEMPVVGTLGKEFVQVTVNIFARDHRDQVLLVIAGEVGAGGKHEHRLIRI